MDHKEFASENSWPIVSRLRVEMASGKLVRTGQRNRCFHFPGVNRKGRERSRSECCAIVKRQTNLHQIFERKAELAVRGEKMAKRKLYEAVANVEVKIVKREILILLFMRSIRSSSPNNFNYNLRIDGQIRFKEIKEACKVNWN